MPAPRELPNKSPPGNSLDTKAPEWGQVFGANPLGVRKTQKILCH